MKGVVISEKGTRSNIEDAYFVDENFSNKGWIYGGIYDGHGGAFAAKYASEKVHEYFLDNLASVSNPEQAFVLSYETVSRDLYDQKSGTTAADFLIKGRIIFTANVGDTRTILIRRNSVIQLTSDHRLSNIAEEDRIKRVGTPISYPYIISGGQGLMTTRSLGDQDLKNIGVIATPSLSTHLITKDDILLMTASDGLWDFINNEEVAVLAKAHPDPESLIAILSHEVLFTKLGTDNLTIIVVALSGKG